MKKCSIFFTFGLILLSILQTNVHAQNTLLDRKVSIEFEDQPIADVLDFIQRRAKIDFSYSPSLIPSSEKISIAVDDKSISEIFKILFANYHISYKEYGDQIIIRKEKGQRSIYKKKEEISLFFSFLSN